MVMLGLVLDRCGLEVLGDISDILDVVKICIY